MFVYIIIFYVLSLRFLREVAELASCDGPQTCEFVYKNVYKTEKKLPVKVQHRVRAVRKLL